MLGIVKRILDSPNMPTRRPVLDANHQSSVPGLYVVGDLAGAPVVKLAMEQGHRVAEHIASLPDANGDRSGEYDLIVCGAGAAGLNAALTAQARGLRVVVLEKTKIANTIEDFPEGKWVYAEPETRPSVGKLWLEEGASKEDLLERWSKDVRTSRLDVRTGEGVAKIEHRSSGGLTVTTTAGDHLLGRRVVLATGQRGTPRRLNVPGEDGEHVHHRLYSPKVYRDREILVVGGGNSAVEAAIALAEQNRVTLSYRGGQFARVFKENRRKLEEAIAAGRIEVVFSSQVTRFGEATYTIQAKGPKWERTYDEAFVLIGADAPDAFLKSLGIRLENEWTGNPWISAVLAAVVLVCLWVSGGKLNAGATGALAGFGALVYSGWRGSRFSWLAVSALIFYAISAAKLGDGHEFWPFRNWGFELLSFGGRPWGFWYTVLYTLLITVFGIQAMRRWGFARKDKFQIWRYVSLISFQWLFFFLIPEFLFRWAVEYQWVGERLANDPTFTQQAWRSYGIVYAWPLFFYTFFGAPHQVWIAWGVLLSFVIIPVLVLFHGKRYCSWICGCGGLAETVGDRWRQLAPKGRNSIRWEKMNAVVLAAAVVVTVSMLGKDGIQLLQKPADIGIVAYRFIVDGWLVSIIPLALYPFFGGKIWCRYWCPLAKMMELFSAVYTRFGVSRFAIHANEKCIACGECTRNCQVGIDVMDFALKQNELNNVNSSCIGCGICVTVCPLDVLSFAPAKKATPLVQIASYKG